MSSAMQSSPVLSRPFGHDYIEVEAETPPQKAKARCGDRRGGRDCFNREPCVRS